VLLSTADKVLSGNKHMWYINFSDINASPILHFLFEVFKAVTMFLAGSSSLLWVKKDLLGDLDNIIKVFLL